MEPAQKRRIGRPPIKLPPDGLVRIRELAAAGHSEQGIAYALGLARDGIQKLKARPGGELIERAIYEGRAQEHQALHGSLVEAAKKGNIIAAIFLLKSRHGYVEARDEAPPPSVNVQITMPGAMRPGDYAKLIEGDPQEAAGGTQLVPASLPTGT